VVPSQNDSVGSGLHAGTQKITSQKIRVPFRDYFTI
jgi:hypothetical protein